MKEHKKNWNKTWLIWATTLGATSIALGALGAHALREVLDTRGLEGFNSAVRYQMYSAIVLMILGFVNPNSKFMKRGAQFIFIGTLMFSVSIYLLLFFKHIEIAYSYLGPITPLGGIFMILGWIFLALGTRK